MKVILVQVCSVNGKTTNGDSPNPFEWTSKEDQYFFKKVIQDHSVIIMGSKTYQVAKHGMRHTSGKLRVIMTKNPERYKDESIPGMLEFSSKSPSELVGYLQSNTSELLLVSGENLNTQFFNQGLIDEFWLTIEPKIFGLGKGVLHDTSLKVNMELMSINTLNSQGTLLLKYKVLR